MAALHSSSESHVQLPPPAPWPTGPGRDRPASPPPPGFLVPIRASLTSKTSRASDHPKRPITSRNTHVPALNAQSRLPTLKYAPSDLEPTPSISREIVGQAAWRWGPGTRPSAGDRHRGALASTTLSPQPSREGEGPSTRRRTAARLPSPQALQGRPRVHHRPHGESESAAHRHKSGDLTISGFPWKTGAGPRGEEERTLALAARPPCRGGEWRPRCPRAGPLLG